MKIADSYAHVVTKPLATPVHSRTVLSDFSVTYPLSIPQEKNRDTEGTEIQYLIYTKIKKKTKNRDTEGTEIQYQLYTKIQ